MNAFVVSVTNHCYPLRLRERLGEGAPEQLTAVGNLELLGLPKTALFCSTRCPGHVILAAYDQAVRWRDEGRCIISGFHSGVEKECLRILLRGRQPIIICPARSLMGLRLPSEWKPLLAEGRLLLLAGFAPDQRRATAALAVPRNELVAALANEAVFAHVTPGGHLEQLAQRIAAWGSFTVL